MSIPEYLAVKNALAGKSREVLHSTATLCESQVPSSRFIVTYLSSKTNYNKIMQKC